MGEIVEVAIYVAKFREKLDYCVHMFTIRFKNTISYAPLLHTSFTIIFFVESIIIATKFAKIFPLKISPYMVATSLDVAI